ncbi:MAG: efflux RND transporter periplasmic adaptor subunit [Verrucomicrobia bacterium]|nr:efflux RND transporter periplasmic adaptor subunit [Verrucomicrobiota bacterium]
MPRRLIPGISGESPTVPIVRSAPVSRPRTQPLLSLLLVVSSLVAGTGCRPDATRTGAVLEPLKVKVSPVEARSWEKTLTVLGSLEAVDRSMLSTKNAGRLRSLQVEVGDRVVAGQTLAQIEPRDFELRLQQAQAQLAQARARVGLSVDGTKDVVDESAVPLVKEAQARLEESEAELERVRSLHEQRISSQAELERAEAQHQVMLNRHGDSLQEARERRSLLAQRRAELDIAQQQLTDTAVRAPFDGVVQSRIANVGEFLPAGSPVLSVVRMDPLRLLLDVPERASAEVSVGQEVRVSVEGGAQSHPARVARMSPALDSRTRLLRVEGELANPGNLRPGSFIRAEIVLATGVRGLAVPSDALVAFAGTEKAFLVQTNQAVERRVTTGRRRDGWVEILGGLQEGDRVIRNPGGIATGSPVAPVTVAPPATGS